MTNQPMSQAYSPDTAYRQPTPEDCRCAGTGRYVTSFTTIRTSSGGKAIGSYQYGLCAAHLHAPTSGRVTAGAWL